MAQQLAGAKSEVLGGAAWTGREMCVGAAIVLGAVVLAAALALLADALGAPNAAVVSVAALVSGGGMLGAVRIVGLAKRGLSWRAVGWRLPADARHWRLAPVALAGSVSFAAVYALTVDALGASFLVPEELPADLLGEGWGALASAFAVVVWTPLAEETFFRGFLFAGLAAKFGLGIGIAASSAIFAASHASIGALVPIMVAGALFAWIYHKSGSLLPAALAHASQNLLAFLAAVFA